MNYNVATSRYLAPVSSHRVQRQAFGAFLQPSDNFFEKVTYQFVADDASRYFGSVGRDNNKTDYAKLDMTLSPFPEEQFQQALLDFIASDKRNLYLQAKGQKQDFIRFFKDRAKLEIHQGSPAICTAINQQLNLGKAQAITPENTHFLTTGQQGSATYIIRKDNNDNVYTLTPDIATYHILVVKNPGLAASLLQH